MQPQPKPKEHNKIERQYIFLVSKWRQVEKEEKGTFGLTDALLSRCAKVIGCMLEAKLTSSVQPRVLGNRQAQLSE